jgi:hypothetical protein
MISRTIGMTHFSHAVHQAAEDIRVLLSEHALVRARSKDNLGRAAKRAEMVRQACPGEFQSMATEGNLGGRNHRHFGFRHKLPDPPNHFREPLPGRGLIGPVHQPGPYVAAIRNLDFLKMILTIFQFV